MDPTTYQQLLVQALMGGIAQPGVSSSAASANPTSPYGQSATTGNPTVAAGMLPNAAGTANPNTPQGAAMLSQQQPPAQGSWGWFQQEMAPYTQNAYPSGQNPFQIAGNQQLQQPFSSYPGMNLPAPGASTGGPGQ